MQIPHCVHSEIPQKSVVRCPAPTAGRCIEAVGDATGESNRRGAFDAGPCAYAGVDSAQVIGVAGGRIPEGKERDPHRPNIHGKAEKLHGGEFLGARVLCLDRGTR